MAVNFSQNDSRTETIDSVQQTRARNIDTTYQMSNLFQGFNWGLGFSYMTNESLSGNKIQESYNTKYSGNVQYSIGIFSTSSNLTYEKQKGVQKTIEATGTIEEPQPTTGIYNGTYNLQISPKWQTYNISFPFTFQATGVMDEKDKHEQKNLKLDFTFGIQYSLKKQTLNFATGYSMFFDEIDSSQNHKQFTLTIKYMAQF